MMEYRRKIIEDFFAFRRAVGMSLRDAAILLGCSYGHLSDVESGRKQAGRRLMVRMVAKLETNSKAVRFGNVNDK